MAIGLARMFGFRIPRELQLPVHRAQSIREFWRRWHISLSTWFRDYLYIPLGGNRAASARAYANLVIVFLLCGLWHGASWTFVLWGVWHGAVPVARARRPRPGAAARRARCAHVYTLRAAGRDGRLGAVPLRHARPRGRLLPRRSRDRPRGTAPARHPVAQYLDPLVATHAGHRHRRFATPLARRVGAWRDARAAHRAPRLPACSPPTSRGWPSSASWPARCWPPAPTIRSFTFASDAGACRRRDPLSLPPVPPPAPAAHPWRDRIVARCSRWRSTLPLAALAITWSRTMTLFEKRPTAPWPACRPGDARFPRRSRARSPTVSAAGTC